MSLEAFFTPRGVAVIGATNKPKGGLAIVVNLIKGFKGGIYPINPGYDSILDLKCYPSVKDVPDPVDLAILFVPAKAVPKMVEECGERGIRAVMIQSAGFSETGPEGKALQDEVDAVAQRHGIRVWGPNCLGMVDSVNHNVFSFAAPSMWDVGHIPGNVSLIVQSGMLAGGFLIDNMSHGTMGMSKVCSIGNKSDVDECDLLEYLISDPDTQAIGMYLEAIPRGRRFAELCRQSPKPIVVLKGGTSTAGAKAAASHTASMSGDGAIVSGVLAQCGVVEARDFKQMLDICRAFGITPEMPPEMRGRTAILTYSGGAGIMAADFVENFGLEVAELSQESKDAMAQVYPDWMPVANPVDLWPSVEKNGAVKTFTTAMNAVCKDPGVDMIFLHLHASGGLLVMDIGELIDMAKEAGKPIFCWLIGQMEPARDMHILAQKLGAPTYRELSRAVESMSTVLGWYKSRAAAPCGVDFRPEPVKARCRALLDGRRGALDEHASKQILAATGIPVVQEILAAGQDQAVTAAEKLGYPVVMKGLAPGMIHKTEQGLVRLNIRAKQEAARTFEDLMSAMDGQGKVLVQQQAVIDMEIIAGLVKDPQFGPCVMCGLGGVYAEVLNDAVFAMAPLDMDAALALIGRLKNQRMLDGFRGAAPVDRMALAEILVRLGALGMELDNVRELDINPLVISEGKPLAVDASIIL
ncbi:CoA-binding domain protein [Desulfatibacillum aliphaticivorans]|uniref:CoA-binding domain protein n=1 Tax=Desulfatibacillum aliphaticivorans TaxID=218208 RepID=B8FN91_DESAL|nr:acetate--CoA ligase family protein [Desulfatibacillum aliphaticivorans]ACL06060.1 CoA-binding domain protein [Desulfatibacillum aliphaticivorans]